MSRMLLLSTILALASPGLAFAQLEDFDREGFYVGAGIFGAHFHDAEDRFEQDLLELGYVVDADVPIAPGLDTRMGYRVAPYFAVEFEAHLITGTDVDIDHTNTLSLETIVVTANGKAFLLTDRIQPFVLFGLGVINYSIKDDVPYGAGDTRKGSAAAFRFGAGADYYINRHLLVSLEANYLYNRGSASAFKYYSLSAGMYYRF